MSDMSIAGGRPCFLTFCAFHPRGKPRGGLGVVGDETIEPAWAKGRSGQLKMERMSAATVVRMSRRNLAVMSATPQRACQSLQPLQQSIVFGVGTDPHPFDRGCIRFPTDRPVMDADPDREPVSASAKLLEMQRRVTGVC